MTEQNAPLPVQNVRTTQIVVPGQVLMAVPRSDWVRAMRHAGRVRADREKKAPVWVRHAFSLAISASLTCLGAIATGGRLWAPIPIGLILLAVGAAVAAIARLRRGRVGRLEARLRLDLLVEEMEDIERRSWTAVAGSARVDEPAHD